ncbi:MAG: hypothetical protein M3O70_08915 [Actinomycetota bacterium]|nr:hypothetical protein [Actinomycetota bacterium]
MGQPTKIVEIDFANGPGAALSAAVWTDVTQWVRSVRTFRGKQQERDDHFQAGTATIVLDNTDGRFDPNNTASPYAPNVLPMRRIRVRAEANFYTDTYSDTYEGVAAPVFVGYIREWPQQWNGPNNAFVTVTAVDGFAILTNRDLPESVFAYEVAKIGPAHWWRLGDASGTAAADSAGSVHGTYSGSPQLGTSGLVEHDSDTAVTFDGVDDKIDIHEKAALTGDFSLVWTMNVAPRAGSSGRRIFTQGDPPSPGYSSIMVGVHDTSFGTANALSVSVAQDSTAFTTVVSNSAVATGTRKTIGIAFTSAASGGPKIEIYIDGMLDTTETALVNAAQPFAGPIRIAAPLTYLGTRPDHLSGVLDEFTMFDGVVLTAAQMAAIASAVDAPWNGDTSGARIGRSLDMAGWPTADRDVDTGQTTFGDGNFRDDQDVLAYLRRCAGSENGHLFVDKSGRVRFIERHALIAEAAYNTSQATFADANSLGVGEFEYHHLELDAFGVDDVYNRVTVQRKFGPTQTVEDAVSQSKFLTRSLSKTSLLMDSDSEARDAANHLLTRHKDPRTKVSQMVLIPGGNNAAWKQVLGRELMDRVTVQLDPPGAGDVLSQEVHIIGIEHEIGPMSWRTRTWLSPADTDAYWILGDSALSVLDTSTRLAY